MDQQHLLIAFCGGPGTGKTTLADAVKLEMKARGIDAQTLPGFAREYVGRAGNEREPIEILDNLHILTESTLREDDMKAQYALTITDDASFHADPYSILYRPEGMNADEQRVWEYHYELIQRLCRRRLHVFDHVFFVPAGRFPADADDPARYNAPQSERVGEVLRAYLTSSGVPFTEITQLGVRARAEEAADALERLGLVAPGRGPVDFW